MHGTVDDRLAVATQVAREAGAVAMGFFTDLASVEIRSKGRQDVVTSADVAVEGLILARLKESFPEDAFLGEETGGAVPVSGGLWVIDPIDGTQEFSLGIRQWCISIAFVVGNEMQIGVVYDPNADELFEARSGGGARLNGRLIAISGAENLEDGVVALEYSRRTQPEDLLHFLSGLLAEGGTYGRGGSGALALCNVACGRLIGFIELHMQSWDCLAALLIIREAGGRTNDFLVEGALTGGNVVIAAPPQLFDQLVRLLPAPFIRMVQA